MANLKSKLSAAMLVLIAAGASAPVMLDQFLDEKEGNTLTAVVDPGGVWSLCRGVMRRVNDSRYPIDVVKVPLAKPLTVNFWKISRQLINSDMGKEISYALKNQLRIHLTR